MLTISLGVIFIWKACISAKALLKKYTFWWFISMQVSLLSLWLQLLIGPKDSFLFHISSRSIEIWWNSVLERLFSCEIVPFSVLVESSTHWVSNLFTHFCDHLFRNEQILELLFWKSLCHGSSLLQLLFFLTFKHLVNCNF